MKWPSSKLKSFVFQRTSFRKWKDTLQNGRKILQIMYLIHGHAHIDYTELL